MKRFDTEAQLALAILEDGQYVETYGKNTKGDNEAARYYVEDSGYVPTANDVTLANGNVAKKVFKLNDLNKIQEVLDIVQGNALDLTELLTASAGIETDSIQPEGAGISIGNIAALAPLRIILELSRIAPGIKFSEEDSMNPGQFISKFLQTVDNGRWNLRKLDPVTDAQILPYALDYRADNSQGDRLFTDGEKIWTSDPLNQGSGSGMDSDKVDGYDAAISPTPETVAVRDAAGLLDALGFKLNGVQKFFDSIILHTGTTPTTFGTQYCLEVGDIYIQWGTFGQDTWDNTGGAEGIPDGTLPTNQQIPGGPNVGWPVGFKIIDFLLPFANDTYLKYVHKYRKIQNWDQLIVDSGGDQGFFDATTTQFGAYSNSGFYSGQYLCIGAKA